MSPIVFLDVDGVVLCERAYQRGRNAAGRLTPEPSCIAALNRITDAADAQIVVSSAWRMFGEERIREILVGWGVTAPIIGITPDLQPRAIGAWVPRGREIATWLAHHPEAARFVILDDDDDMEHLLAHLVHTTFKDGLTERDADKALVILALR
jgi:hypothetical protein